MHSSFANPMAGPGGTAPDPATAEEAILSTMMSLGRRMRRRYPADEVDFSAFHVLKALRQHGPMRLSSLAGLLELDASTVSRHVRQLEERGLVERADDPDDRRASRIAVSDSGASCLDKGVQTRLSALAEVFESWPAEDRERLRALLTRLQHDLAHQDPQENP